MSPAIVCGVDRSRHAWAAARLASALARRLDMPLEFVHVCAGGEGVDVHSARSLQDDLCQALDRGSVALRLETGSVADSLAAAGRRAALLVIGTRGEGALRRALLGSTSASLTRRPPVPVIVVPPGAMDSRGAPIAGGAVVCGVRDRGDVTTAETGAMLAGGLGLRMTLVHIVAPPRIPVSAAGGAPPAQMLRRTSEDATAAREMLDAIARSVQVNAGGSWRLKVVEGPVGPQLAQVAATQDAALIALGASDRGSLAAAVAGSASLHVLRRAGHPVMVCPRRVCSVGAAGSGL